MLVVGLIGLGYVLAAIIFMARSVLTRPARASGDDELARTLRALAGRRSHRVAAAVVDLNAEATVRTAFLAASGQTRFEIGSITKGLTGMLLADAIERGELALDTTVGEVMPEVAAWPLAGVTLRELAWHTSGLPRLAWTTATPFRLLAFGLFGLDPYRGISGARLIDSAARHRLRRRGRMAYSNLGAAVLGQVLARRADCDFASLLAERVLVPCAMSDAGVAVRGRTAAPGRSGAGVPRRPWIMDGHAAAGGVIATVDDMAALAVRILDGRAPGLASLEPLDADLVADPAFPQRRHGMFWIIDTPPDGHNPVIWHNGATGGYSAFLALYPATRRAVIVLADTARAGDQERIAHGLLRSTRSGGAPGQQPVTSPAP